ncbi:hypothetical protein HDU67_006438 [Dinochytrium kinnereticum]|nr:hypothetical protein HDU67_006438 [Dinochytrium kinnereticum]
MSETRARLRKITGSRRPGIQETEMASHGTAEDCDGLAVSNDATDCPLTEVALPDPGSMVGGARQVNVQSRTLMACERKPTQEPFDTGLEPPLVGQIPAAVVLCPPILLDSLGFEQAIGGRRKDPEKPMLQGQGLKPIPATTPDPSDNLGVSTNPQTSNFSFNNLVLSRDMFQSKPPSEAVPPLLTTQPLNTANILGAMSSNHASAAVLERTIVGKAQPKRLPLDIRKAPSFNMKQLPSYSGLKASQEPINSPPVKSILKNRQDPADIRRASTLPTRPQDTNFIPPPLPPVPTDEPSVPSLRRSSSSMRSKNSNESSAASKRASTITRFSAKAYDQVVQRYVGPSIPTAEVEGFLEMNAVDPIFLGFKCAQVEKEFMVRSEHCRRFSFPSANLYQYNLISKLIILADHGKEQFT